MKKHSSQEANRQIITTVGTDHKNFPIIPPMKKRAPKTTQEAQESPNPSQNPSQTLPNKAQDAPKANF